MLDTLETFVVHDEDVSVHRDAAPKFTIQDVDKFATDILNNLEQVLGDPQNYFTTESDSNFQDIYMTISLIHALWGTLRY